MKYNNERRLGIAVIVFSALLGVAIWFGQRRESNREAGFFVDERDRVWQVTPVVVSYSEDVAKAFEQQVKEAVRDINHEVGCTVLLTTGAPVQIRIFDPIDDVPCHGRGRVLPPGAGAGTYVCPGATTDIVVEKLAHSRQAYVGIKHELGHALGLDDDLGGEDVMAQRLPDERWQDTSKPLPWLSSKDRRVLRERYCR